MSLHFPFPDAPGKSEAVTIAPCVRWMRSPLPLSLNHINCYLLRDQDGWCVVDTGMNGAEAKQQWLDVIESQLQGEPITRVLVTHHHPDHVGLAGWLCDQHNANLYMSEKEYFYTCAFNHIRQGEPYWEVESYFDETGISKQDRSALLANQDYNHLVSEVPGSVHLLADGDTVTIGEHTWEAINTRGHSPEHLSLYCQALDILISGDQVLPGITSNVSVSPTLPAENPLKDWLLAHDTVKQRVPDSALVLPAHQLPFKGLHERLQQVVDHHAHRLDELETLCEQPQTAQELTYQLFDRKLEAFQNFLAVGECVAHLHYLLYQNRVTRQLIDGQTMYRRANQV